MLFNNVVEYLDNVTVISTFWLVVIGLTAHIHYSATLRNAYAKLRL